MGSKDTLIDGLLALDEVPEGALAWLLDACDPTRRVSVLRELAGHPMVDEELAERLYTRFEYAGMRTELISRGLVSPRTMVAQLAGERRVTVLREMAQLEQLEEQVLAALHRAQPLDVELCRLLLDHPNCGQELSQEIVGSLTAPLADLGWPADVVRLVAHHAPARLVEVAARARAVTPLRDALVALAADGGWSPGHASKAVLLVQLLGEDDDLTGRRLTRAATAWTREAAACGADELEELPGGSALLGLFERHQVSLPDEVKQLTARYHRTLRAAAAGAASDDPGEVAAAWDLALDVLVDDDGHELLGQLVANPHTNLAGVQDRLTYRWRTALQAHVTRLDDVAVLVRLARSGRRWAQMVFQGTPRPALVEAAEQVVAQEVTGDVVDTARQYLARSAGWRQAPLTDLGATWLHNDATHQRIFAELAQRPAALDTAASLLEDGFEGSAGELIDLLDTLVGDVPGA